MKKKLNLLILGSGMFTTGRGTQLFGTILPSIFEASLKDSLQNIVICSTTIQSSKKAEKKVNQLLKIYNIKINIYFYPNINKTKYKLADIVKKHECNSSIVSIPDHLHYKYVIQLLNLKLHCLVVKPMTTNKSYAKKMTELSKKNNLIGMVEFHKRYDHANIILKDKIKNNELGNLEYAIIEYSQRKSIPLKSFSKWVNKTNIFQYLGIHYVDLIYYLTSFKPINVLAYGQKDYLKSKNINTFDSIQVIVEWKKKNKDKFVSFHISNWIESNKSSAMSDQTIKVIGTRGKIISDQKNRGLQLLTDDKGVEDINPYFTTIIQNKNSLSNQSFGYGISSLQKYFELCTKFLNNKNNVYKYMSRNRDIPSFETSYVSTVILEAANKSLKYQKKINIKL